MISKKLIKTRIEDLSAIGTLPVYLLLSFLILGFGETRLFISLIIGLIFSYAIGISIRLFFYSDRPEKESYENALEKIDASSFPSLHSMRMTMLALFFSYYYWSLYFIALFIFVSVFVLLSRYYLKKHYLSDIIFGALFGVLCFLVTLLLI